jgi:hypothetical protein
MSQKKAPRPASQQSAPAPEVVAQQEGETNLNEAMSETTTSQDTTGDAAAETLAAEAASGIEPAKVSEEAPQAAAAQEVAAPAPDSDEAIFAAAEKNASTVAKLQLNTIREYMLAMAPNKPITPAAGARQQVMLYRALIGIINLLGDDFNQVWSAVLKLFLKHRSGVFNEMGTFRFTEHMEISKQDRDTYLRLLNLINVTADPKGRQVALRQVRLEETLNYGVQEAGRQRIQAFYNV